MIRPRHFLTLSKYATSPCSRPLLISFILTTPSFSLFIRGVLEVAGHSLTLDHYFLFFNSRIALRALPPSKVYYPHLLFLAFQHLLPSAYFLPPASFHPPPVTYSLYPYLLPPLLVYLLPVTGFPNTYLLCTYCLYLLPTPLPPVTYFLDGHLPACTYSYSRASCHYPQPVDQPHLLLLPLPPTF